MLIFVFVDNSNLIFDQTITNASLICDLIFPVPYRNTQLKFFRFLNAFLRKNKAIISSILTSATLSLVTGQLTAYGLKCEVTVW